MKAILISGLLCAAALSAQVSPPVAQMQDLQASLDSALLIVTAPRQTIDPAVANALIEEEMCVSHAASLLAVGGSFSGLWTGLTPVCEWRSPRLPSLTAPPNPASYGWQWMVMPASANGTNQVFGVLRQIQAFMAPYEGLAKGQGQWFPGTADVAALKLIVAHQWQSLSQGATK